MVFYAKPEQSQSQSQEAEVTPTWSLWVLITSPLQGPASLWQTQYKRVHALIDTPPCFIKAACDLADAPPTSVYRVNSETGE